MSGTVGDNTARASGVIASASGGGVLQVKTTYYTAQHTLNSATWAVFDNAFAVTITPTASNSTFWLDANVSLGASHQDYCSSLNFFDSQVGTSDGDEIFTPTAVSSGSRPLGAFPGCLGNAQIGNWNHNAMFYGRPSGLYTPASNNGSARTFYVCAKRGGADLTGSLNYGGTDATYVFAGVSNITVFEIANSII